MQVEPLDEVAVRAEPAAARVVPPAAAVVLNASVEEPGEPLVVAAAPDAPVGAWVVPPVVAAEPEKPAAVAKGKRVNPIKLRQMQERCSYVEEEIPRIENSIAVAEESLGVYESAEETQRLTRLLEDLRAQHASLTAEWEELLLQLEQQA